MDYAGFVGSPELPASAALGHATTQSASRRPRRFLAHHSQVKWRHLIGGRAECAGAASLYAAIARGAVAFDLQSSPLANQASCELFRDETTMRAFQIARAKPVIEQRQFDAGVVQIRVGTRQFMWNAVRWRCIGIADDKVSLTPSTEPFAASWPKGSPPPNKRLHH